MTDYYVGTHERIKVDGIKEAYRTASQLIGEKTCGKSAKIYRGANYSNFCTAIEILPNKKGKLCFVVFQNGSKTGHALSVDYKVDRSLGVWENIKYGGLADA